MGDCLNRAQTENSYTISAAKSLASRPEVVDLLTNTNKSRWKLHGFQRDCFQITLAIRMSSFHMTSTLNSLAKLGCRQRWLSFVSLGLNHMPMKTLILTFTCLISSLGFLNAQDPTTRTPVPLAPGKYLLIENDDLTKTDISFTKGRDGKLTLSCPSAPASPVTVFQQGPLFQFLLLYLEPENGRAVRCMTYMGYGVSTKSENGVAYRGSCASLGVAEGPSTQVPFPHTYGEYTGTFVLHKLSDKP